ncbi:MAG: patatin-like phospholipase family protein, partial [Treponema sp.]|nr:patatin-like phospholipase family protein [Treponema sp.]
ICLFGGGAIRGAAHVGAIKAMEECGISCDTYGGSSVGSMVAVLRAIGYTLTPTPISKTV